MIRPLLKNNKTAVSAIDKLIFSVSDNFCAILPSLGFHIIVKGIIFIKNETRNPAPRIKEAVSLYKSDKNVDNGHKIDDITVMLKK